MSIGFFLFVLVVQFIFFLSALGLLLYFGYVFMTLGRELPYVPTPYSVIRRMIACAKIQANDRVIDLGSGTGRIVLEVARQYPVTAIGVERSKLLLRASRFREFFIRIKGNVIWERKDLFTYPLNGVTVVFCFLITSVLERLASKFETLPSGSRIVSYKFLIPLSKEWEYTYIPFGRKDRMHLYRKK